MYDWLMRNCLPFEPGPANCTVQWQKHRLDTDTKMAHASPTLAVEDPPKLRVDSVEQSPGCHSAVLPRDGVGLNLLGEPLGH